MCCYVLSYYVLGQVYDNFSDGDFANNPARLLNKCFGLLRYKLNLYVFAI